VPAAIGLEVEPIDVPDALRFLLDELVSPGGLIEHVLALSRGDVRDSGLRIIGETGSTSIDFDYGSLPTGDGVAEPEPPGCSCLPGPSLERWPGWVTMTIGDMPPGAALEIPHKLESADERLCSRCGGEWPCASMLAGRDVDPEHAPALLHLLDRLFDDERFLQQWRWSKVHEGVVADLGWRRPSPEGGRLIVFHVDSLDDDHIVSPGMEDPPLLDDESSENELKLLRLLNRGPRHGGAMAAELRLSAEKVERLLGRLENRGFIERV
jgi:hypothetical protein